MGASRAGACHSRGVRCQPKSNTGAGVIGPNRDQTRFWTFGVLNLEFLEICEFVWPRGIFPEVSWVNAFDSCRQIAKRFCNEGVGLQQGVGHDPKI